MSGVVVYDGYGRIGTMEETREQLFTVKRQRDEIYEWTKAMLEADPKLAKKKKEFEKLIKKLNDQR